MTVKVAGRKWGRAVLGIHIACTIVALLVIASLAFVLDRSVSEADRFGLTAERKLIESELEHQIDAVVQYQATLSFWDRTFAELGNGGFAPDFVKEQMTDWLWSDFGFSWMIFSDSAQHTLLAVKDGQPVAPAEGGVVLNWADDLIERANGLYDDAVVASGNGWALRPRKRDRDALSAPVPNIHAADLRMIDGHMSVVVVQAVVPKSLAIPASRRRPVFMVTVKPFTATMLANMEERLGVENLTFVPRDRVPAGSIHVSIDSCVQSSCRVAAWKPNAPGSFVRAETLPSVIVIAMMAAMLMAFIALRFGAVFSALQTSEAKNRHLAKHDRLTGLMNRSGFDEAIAAACFKGKDGHKGKGGAFALLCIDLDKFKAVNDTHGHAAGDAVLKTVSERFSSRVGGRGIVARLGGDEFAVILHRPTSDSELSELAHGLIVDAQIPVVYDGQLLQVGGSIGSAFAPRHGTSPHELLLQADQALYLAKNCGRNCYRTADDLLGNDLRERAA